MSAGAIEETVRLWLVVPVLAAVIGVPVARGHGDPDQLHDPPSPYFQNWWCDGAPGPAQSFSPSRRQLAAVDVRVRGGIGWPAGGPNPDIELTIRRDRIDGPLVGTTRAYAGQAPTPIGGSTKLVHVDFSPPLVLEPAGTFVIEFNPMKPTLASWIGATANTYPGGMMFTCGGAAVSGYDFNFNTYVPADAAAPETRLTGGVRAGSISNRTTVSFTFDGSDDLSYAGRLRFLCSLDGAATSPCGSPMIYAALGAGSHTFAVQAIDEAGNVDPMSETVGWTIRLDFDAPETTVAGSVLHGAYTSRRSAIFTLAANEQDVDFECEVDRGGWQPCDPRVELSNLPDGRHTLDVRSTDLLGNVDATPAHVEWVVDTVAPSQARLTKLDARARRLSVKLTAEDPPRRNRLGFICSVDRHAFVRCSNPWRVRLPPGRHVLRAAARDLAGNTGRAGTLAVVVR
jgi:hypothetical protein